MVCLREKRKPLRIFHKSLATLKNCSTANIGRVFESTNKKEENLQKQGLP